MPRYSSLIVRDVTITDNNVNSVFVQYKQNYKFEKIQDIENDIRLNWDGDIDFDDFDVRLVYSLETLIQRLFIFFITQDGRLPGETFGWNLEGLIGNTSKINLSNVLTHIKEKLEESFKEVIVNNIELSEIMLEDSRAIRVSLDVQPANFTYRIFLVFDLFR